MKKINLFRFFILAVGMVILASQDAQSAEKTVPVTIKDSSDKEFIVQIPLNPQRVVAIDYVAVDMLDSWGMGDRIVGMAKSSKMPHLQKYLDNPKIADIGTLKKFDLEKIKGLNPDIIFISGRARSSYNDFAKIAPTVINSIDYKMGAFKSFEQIGMRNAAIFGVEDTFKAQLSSLQQRVANLQKASKGKKAIIANIVGGEVIVLSSKGRLSMIPNSFGFENPAQNITSERNTKKAFKNFVELDPDYIFVLSKDIAVGSEGAQPIATILDDDMVRKTKAFKAGNIIYLTPPVWYLSEGGIIAMDIMLQDIEKAISK